MNRLNKIVCVTFDKANKRFMVKQSKKKKFGLQYTKFTKNDTVYNHAKSHFNVIAEARKERAPHVYIMEDHIKLLAGVGQFPLPPADWGMIYLGGEAIDILEKRSATEGPKLYWRHARVHQTKGYIVNRNLYDEILDKGREWLRSLKNLKGTQYEKVKNLSEFYADIIHRNMEHRTYILKQPLIVDRNEPETPEKLREATTEVVEKTDGDGNKFHETTLKFDMNPAGGLPDDALPSVSLITPVSHGDSAWFFFTIMNFLKIKYPKEKLQWIVVDDNDTFNCVKEQLPEDKRIKYIRCNVADGNSLSLGRKLNAAVDNCTNDIILHWFDKTYYPPESVHTRVRALLLSNNVECVGSSVSGHYHLHNNNSYLTQDHDKFSHPSILYEPTMAYTKKFWNLRNFENGILNDNQRNIVSIPYTVDRYERLLTLPYIFVGIGISTDEHNQKNILDTGNFVDGWDNTIVQALQCVKEDLKEANKPSF